MDIVIGHPNSNPKAYSKQGRRGGLRLDAHEDYIVAMIEGEKDITLNKMILRLVPQKGPYPWPQAA